MLEKICEILEKFIEVDIFFNYVIFKLDNFFDLYILFIVRYIF